MNELDAMFNKSNEPSSFQDLITEAVDEVSKISFDCDGTCANAQVLANSIVRDYNLNCKQSALKCFKEGGTEDDLAFYEDRASEGAVGKLKAIIDKVILIWRDTIYKIKMTVATKIQSSSGKAALKDAKKQVAMHPEIANVKVKAPDITTALSVISKFRGLCNVESEQYVRSLTGVTKVKSIGGLMEDFQKSFDRAIVGKAAICVVTIAGLIMAIEAEMNKLPSLIDELDLKETTILKRLSATVSYETEVGAVATFQQAAQFRVQLGKQELNTHMKYLADMVSRLTSAINEALTGKAPIINNVVEDADGAPMLSVDEYFGEDSESDEVFDEGVNGDAHAILKQTSAKYKEAMAKVKSAKTKSDWSAAKNGCQQAISAIDDAKKEIKALPATAGSSAIGMLISFLESWLRAAVAAEVSYQTIGKSMHNKSAVLIDATNKAVDAGDKRAEATLWKAAQLTARIGNNSYDYGASISGWLSTVRGIKRSIHAVKDNNGIITVAQFNTCINKIISILDGMKKRLQKQITICESNAKIMKEEVDDSSVFSTDYVAEDVDSDEIFDEGANLDARRVFKTVKVQYKDTYKRIRKASKSGDYKKALAECKKLNGILDNAEKCIRSLEPTVGSVVLGWFASNTIYALKTTAVATAVVAGGAAAGAAVGAIFQGNAVNAGMVGACSAYVPAGVYATIKLLVTWVKRIVGIIDSLRKLDKSKSVISAFDMYINDLISAIGDMKKSVGVLEGCIKWLEDGADATEKALKESSDDLDSDIDLSDMIVSEDADATFDNIMKYLDSVGV